MNCADQAPRARRATAAGRRAAGALVLAEHAEQAAHLLHGAPGRWPRPPRGRRSAWAGSVSRTRRAAPDCTSITLMLWATTSCSSGRCACAPRPPPAAPRRRGSARPARPAPARAATLARRVWRLSPISHTVAKMTMLLAIEPIVTSQRAVRSTMARPTAVNGGRLQATVDGRGGRRRCRARSARRRC